MALRADSSTVAAPSAGRAGLAVLGWPSFSSEPKADVDSAAGCACAETAGLAVAVAIRGRAVAVATAGRAVAPVATATGRAAVAVATGLTAATVAVGGLAW